MRFRTMCFAALAAVLLAGLVHADVMLALDPPDGAIFGQPGQTVGWGYTLSTTDPGFLRIEGFLFYDDNPAIGTFYPSGFAPPFWTASSGSPLSVAFNASLGDGIGYLVGPAPAGSITVGYLSAIYQVWNLDPSIDPTAEMLSGGNEVFVTDAAGAQTFASVTVLEGQAVPEPATGALAVCAMSALAFLLRRKAS